jgi:hypothetical protein
VPRHHKVHELLDREELDALEAFAREPGRTVDEVHEWLQAKGYTLARSSAGRWLSAFVAEDKFKAASEVARSIVTAAADDKGAVAIADATALKVNQMVFEAALRLQSDDQVETKELLQLAQAWRHGVLGKRDVERVRSEIADRDKAAVAAMEQQAKAGASPDELVKTARELLGIK